MLQLLIIMNYSRRIIPTRPDPTQLNLWMDPTHVQLYSSDEENWQHFVHACRHLLLFHTDQHAPICIIYSRTRSAVRVSASLKKIPYLLGRLYNTIQYNTIY